MVFKNHQHQEHEYLIVYAGRLHVHLVRGDNFIDIIIGPGESAHILPKEEHWVKALETTHMVGITVPASEGYPRA
jgi:quercetin dioxygenase-like cupin family protein